MGYINRLGQGPGVRTPIDFEGGGWDQYQGCGVIHELEGYFVLYFDDPYWCSVPGQTGMDQLVCPPKEVVLDLKVTSTCECMSESDIRQKWDFGETSQPITDLNAIQFGVCEPKRVNFSWYQFDIAGIDCGTWQNNCNGQDSMNIETVIPYEDLLAAVPTELGKDAGDMWGTNWLNIPGFKGLVDQNGDGFIDGTDCKCLFPFNAGTPTDPDIRCAVSPKTLECMTSHECSSNLLSRDYYHAMALLVYNYLLGVRKPIPCAEGDE